MHLAALALVLALLAGSTYAADEAAQLATASGTLQGTLTLPARAAPRAPVALLIAGSGPTDRDGNTPLAAGRNDALKLLAPALADGGVASLRYDKRGIAASAGAGSDESSLRFDDYVDDAAAWAAQLARDPRFGAVVIVGHSEGATIGLLAALRAPVAAYVSIAGPAQPAAAVLRRQLAGRLPPELAAQSEAALAALEAGRLATDVPPALMALYRPSVQPYLISWFRHTPADSIARLQRPCLIVQGDTDIQVGLADAQALKAAQPACELAVIAGMNHVLKAVPADPARQIASYGDPTLPLADALAPALLRFVAAATAPR
ncbi:alpha/beta hydrolase [Rubrivivax gelatinosus]|uniref:alpha/beta fold hydrolase n=1 Tax=Rubrivivax gelatinosus TaxID=28068 RepID=UPI001903CBD8|nr:alpha/beta hydrolase [Rubrivivax gelatinosus]MBK1615055.1 alpha/beta hydrolase [Rubrivivax gelatinosus]